MKTTVYFITFFFCFTCYYLQAQTTFDYTGAVQTYTVPECVYSITVDVKGAEGSESTSPSPAPTGKGGRVQATIPVTPGEVLNIYVGEKPLSNAGGWNGGGTGGTGGSDVGGGGGASDIRQGGNELTNRVVIAGGGGGAGYDLSDGASFNGGNGGGPESGRNGGNASEGGKGGTQENGGTGGTSGANGSPGELGIGGDGGGPYGAGGGGGYYGGGGGGENTTFLHGGGGGGGSSYTIPTATGVVHTQGSQSGNGQVVITAGTSGPPAPDSIAGPDSACINSTVNYSIDSVLGATSYTWTFPSGTAIISGDGTASVEVAIGTTSGDISVTATTACGTSEARTKPLTVVDCGGTGIRSNSDKLDLLVFPNPAADVLQFQLNTVVLKQVNVAMMNVQGQVVYSGTIHAGPIKEVDISSLPKGFYYLRAMSEGFFAVRKIVIQ